ncbi:helix-hairpin-helix domain-containing protein [Neorhizobium sp. SOG26]|jgi:hypothetical protein|uniref:Helix-hairpin-helix domain-containing protein n=1 Tax=Neorhizobium turbinariae TaxID=2937795 RepID=A0ABT0IWF7_9HYPH|nr:MULTISPECIES: helix-hairpin-helix domain-containing protein [Neorhizobium]AXV15992.1 helix-hairpin-helix domain-containing protein [Neorhizobium sp. SOG26]MCK8782205.1 helix-hairpin-helix domain-containing protein [Neorhizobium turbinariae]
MHSRQPTKRSDLVIRSNLPGWLIKALRESGVKRLSRLQQMSDKEVLDLPGVGTRSLQIIRTALAPDQQMH